MPWLKGPPCAQAAARVGLAEATRRAAEASRRLQGRTWTKDPDEVRELVKGLVRGLGLEEQQQQLRDQRQGRSQPARQLAESNRAAHPTHRMAARGQWTFCSWCGKYSGGVYWLFAEACRPPTEGGKRAVKRILRGLAPHASYERVRS